MVSIKKMLNMKKCLLLLFVLSCCIHMTGETNKGFFLRGAFYQDWMGLKSEGIDLYSRLSSRLKLTFLNKPGSG